TLVGARTAATLPVIPAVQASPVLGDGGPPTGVLLRPQTGVFAPMAAGPLHGVNTQLTQMAYQARTPFPAISTAGMIAAETYIGQALNLCPESATLCDVRAAYYLHYSAKWGTKYTDLVALEPPSDAT